MLIYAHKAVAAPEAALIGSCRSVCVLRRDAWLRVFL